MPGLTGRLGAPDGDFLRAEDSDPNHSYLGGK